MQGAKSYLTQKLRWLPGPGLTPLALSQSPVKLALDPKSTSYQVLSTRETGFGGTVVSIFRCRN